jgi:hypothetical protein
LTVEQAVYERLAAAAGVTDLIQTRIYPILAPQDVARPYVVFARQETANLATLGGRGTHDRVDLQVICHAETVDGARALASAVIVALDEWRGAGVVEWCRLTARTQARTQEVDAAPSLYAEALLFLILAVET